LALVNGAGYHGDEDGEGLRGAWRLTGHILGTGKKHVHKTDRYADVSFFGQYNKDHKALKVTGANKEDEEDEDLIFYGLHTVYNQAEFLLSAQYIYSVDTRDDNIEVDSKLSDVSAQAGSGYSFNAEYRLGSKKQFRLLTRFDSWTPEIGADIDALDILKNYEQKTYIAGLAWDQNRNVQWVANVDIIENEDGSSRKENNAKAYKLTAQVKF